VISFEPAMAREQVIEAASEFDYTVFGSGSYIQEDVRPANIFGGGQTRTYAFEAGVRQKFVTGLLLAQVQHGLAGRFIA